MKYQVIIAGFGTAGAIAAIAAARRGAKVLVLERNTCPGGMQAGGFIFGYYLQQPMGLTAEIEELIQQQQKTDRLGGQPVENRREILENLALEAKAELRYQAVISEILEQDGKIKGVVWHEQGKRFCAECDVLLDCSADAEIARHAGIETFGGRESDGQFQPFTNLYAFRTAAGIAAAANFDAGRIDQYDIRELTQIMLETSRLHLRQDYQNNNPNRLLAPSDQIGVREGLHIRSRKILTLQELLDDKLQVDDPIDWVSSNIDTHASDFCLESTIFQDWMLGASMWGTVLWIPISLGCLLPEKGPEGLLIAGRHLGVDHDLGHAVRMNACMGRLGEVAGTLAALAVQQNCTPSRIPYRTLADALNIPSTPPGDNHALFALSASEIKDGLASDAPGKAIWAARTQGQLELLQEIYAEAEPGSHLRRHAAQALALLDCDTGAEELRACLAERDPWRPKTSRNRNHARGYVAVYLLGRLADCEAIPLLQEVWLSPPQTDTFQYQSQAMMALLKIAEKHPLERMKIADSLKKLTETREWRLESLSHLHRNNPERHDIIFRAIVAAALERWNIPHQFHKLLPPLNPSLQHLRIAQRICPADATAH